MAEHEGETVTGAAVDYAVIEHIAVPRHAVMRASEAAPSTRQEEDDPAHHYLAVVSLGPG